MLRVRRVSGEVLADVSVEDCQNVLQVKIFLRNQIPQKYPFALSILGSLY